eukprot:jgi/Bigna1/67125/fgenesh1_pg.3_\
MDGRQASLLLCSSMALFASYSLSGTTLRAPIRRTITRNARNPQTRLISALRLTGPCRAQARCRRSIPLVKCSTSATTTVDSILQTADDFPMLIDGKLRTKGSAGVSPVINPATEEPFAYAPSASIDDLNDAVMAAKGAFSSWSTLDYESKVAYLERFALEVKKDAENIATILTKEQGKPYASALGEIKASADRIATVSALGPLEAEVLHEDEKTRTEVHRVPRGVVAAITPWNFPVLIAASKAASALLSGNTVVIKPSPFTPLSTLALGKAAERADLPPGVINIVSGGDDLGKALAEHKDVRHISFTGSVATGKKVMATAAAGLKRVTLELGGNDAAIVLEDVDIGPASRKIFQASMANTGQVCTAIKRLYVHEKVFDPLVEALVAHAKNATVGDGLTKGVTHGPLNNKMQYNIVTGLLDDAKQQGAKVLCGGEAPEGPGYFFPPTLVTDVKEGVRLVDEEQFGPVLPVIPFTDVDDAVTRANASPFGLGGSVWTRDSEKGAQIAARLETGVTWVNAHITGDFAGKPPPFGGAKMSGIGREHGRAGLEEYTDLKTIRVAKKL